MTKQTEPMTLSLPRGGKAVQWWNIGDHDQVGLPLPTTLGQKCQDCGRLPVDHGMLYGREPTKVCPGDFILSSPSLKYHHRIDPWTFDLVYSAQAIEGKQRIEGQEQIAEEPIAADDSPQAEGFEPLAAANDRVMKRLYEQREQEARARSAGAVLNPEFLQSLPRPATLEQAILQRDGWIEACAFHEKNERFYRGIVVQIGNMFGEAAKTSDDGTVRDDVLVLRVPELVAMELALQQANNVEIERLNSELSLMRLRTSREIEELQRTIAIIRGGGPDANCADAVALRERLAKAEAGCAHWRDQFGELVKMASEINLRIEQLEAAHARSNGQMAN